MFFCCSGGAAPDSGTTDNGISLAFREATEDFDKCTKLEDKLDFAEPQKPTAPTAKDRAAAQANITLFHYAVRWAKPWPEVEKAASGIDMEMMCCAKHPQNGNSAIHIAAQNGHLYHVQQLIASGALLNERNAKGNTALHMSVEYDYYFTSKVLLASGADRLVENDAGHLAIHGIEGEKTGLDGWDNPVNVLRAASNKGELDIAYKLLEMALDKPERISKENLIKTGLAKKVTPTAIEYWDHRRFLALAKKF